ncbi:MAG: hypothetical protein LBQ59_02850 [Candidatus Peribacteria bacterium]|nr:hypothetical protein [Candidatus Peribacteria bacterium]
MYSPSPVGRGGKIATTPPCIPPRGGEIATNLPVRSLFFPSTRGDFFYKKFCNLFQKCYNTIVFR